MATVKISPSKLNGSVIIPPSKSAAHRALICSFLSGGGSVKPIIDSNDMKATLGVIESLKNNNETLDCIESGSTVRFMIPVVASLGKEATFIGQGRLPERPLDEYVNLLPLHGVSVKTQGGLPFKISGQLKNGSYEVNGDVSSQYITGLLLALANLEGDSAVILKTELQSKPYVDMTVKVLNDYGVSIKETDFGYLIKGSQKFKQLDYVVEGDWSQAAFFLSAAALCGEITVKGLDINSTQGDKEIVNVLKSFGAQITIDENGVTAKKKDLKSTNIDATNIPDLVPIIAVVASFCNGTTTISGAERLRYKESDRIKSVITNLKLIGVDVKETQDGMIIKGSKNLHSANLDGFNDHRIVMAFSVAALFLDGETTITDAQSINKSYPTFFDDYNELGGLSNVF